VILGKLAPGAVVVLVLDGELVFDESIHAGISLAGWRGALPPGAVASPRLALFCVGRGRSVAGRQPHGFAARRAAEDPSHRPDALGIVGRDLVAWFLLDQLTPAAVSMLMLNSELQLI
jgi:hypothetical protein